MPRYCKSLFSFPLALAGAALLMLAVPARANTYTVSNLNDSGTGSLRQAISSVNLDSSPDVIQFSAGLTGQISLTSGQLIITNDVTLEGPGANMLAVDAGGLSALLQIGIVAGGTLNVTIQGLTLRNGASDAGTGGIQINHGASVTLEDCAVTGNTSSSVGAINNNGVLLAQRCLIANNVAVGGGGTAGAGGAIYSDGNAVTLENCTLVGNQAGSGGAVFWSANGSGPLTMESCTVTANTAANLGGGIFSPGGEFYPHNCIIAGNSASKGSDVYGAVESEGYNLIGNTAGSFVSWVASDLQNVSPLLGALSDNGGPTQTCALLPGSPALFAADPNNYPLTDQRGVRRPQGTYYASIGAFELQAANAGPNQTVTIPHDGNPATSTVAVTLDGSASLDPYNGGLTYAWDDGQGHTATGVKPTVNLPAGIYTFTLTVINASGTPSVATVTITVNPESNAAPVANSQSISLNQGVATSVTLVGSDPDGDAITYQMVTGPAHGTLSETVPNLTYTPNTGYAGIDSFTFTVTDSYGAVSAPATVSLTVKDTTPPVITLNGSSPMGIVQGSAFTDPGAMAVDNVDGSVPVSVSGAVNTTVSGTYTLTYSATDNAGNTASITRTVIVTPASRIQVKLTAIGELLGIVGAVVTVENTSSATISNVKITSASLIGVHAALVLPGGFSLKAGQSQDVGLVFFPLKRGQTGVLSISGSYSGGTFSLTQTVTIP